MKYILLLLAVLFLLSSISKKEKYYDYCSTIDSTRVLIFSWENYDYFNDLNSPHADSDSIFKDFKMNFLHVNQFKDLTIAEFYVQMRSFSNSDSHEPLIIYMVGRGFYDEVFEEGYLVCKNSLQGDEIMESYVSFSNLKTIMRRLNSRQVFWITDIDFDLRLDRRIGQNVMPYQNTELVDDQKKYLDTCFHLIDHKELIWLSSGNSGFGTENSEKGKLSDFGNALHQTLKSDKPKNVSELFKHAKSKFPKLHLSQLGKDRKYEFVLSR